jgi:hypothetical protein
MRIPMYKYNAYTFIHEHYVHVYTRPEISLFSLHPATVFIFNPFHFVDCYLKILYPGTRSIRLFVFIFILFYFLSQPFALSAQVPSYWSLPTTPPRGSVPQLGQDAGPRGSATRVRPSSPLVDVE